eukprot:g26462.t1
MNLPENFGEDRDEDLLSALAKITYHLRRERHEDHRTFFNRWEEALRRVSEHGVVLPDQYKGFLLVNAMALSEQDIKGLLNFTRGSIATKDVKEWTRKHETKLMVKEVGTDTQRKGKTTSGTSSSSAVHRMTAEETGDFHDEDEILEAVLEELDGDEDAVQPDGDQEGEEEPLEEHEIREVLNTMFQKRTFSQSLKLKKAKELARGYGGWKGSGKDKGKQGKSKLIDQMKQNSRCAICKKIGHWHRECPDGKGRGKTGPKEAYYLQNLATEETEEAFFCGHLEVDPEPLPDEQLAKLNDEMLFRLADPEDREMKEIYGDQYRHFDETYEPGDADLGSQHHPPTAAQLFVQELPEISKQCYVGRGTCSGPFRGALSVQAMAGPETSWGRSRSNRLRRRVGRSVFAVTLTATATLLPNHEAFDAVESQPDSARSVFATGPLGGWRLCAREGGSCNCVGTVALHSWLADWSMLRHVNGSIPCSVAFFGHDPRPHLPKLCSCLASLSWPESLVDVEEQRDMALRKLDLCHRLAPDQALRILGVWPSNIQMGVVPIKASSAPLCAVVYSPLRGALWDGRAAIFCPTEPPKCLEGSCECADASLSRIDLRKRRNGDGKEPKRAALLVGPACHRERLQKMKSPDKMSKVPWAGDDVCRL